MCGITGFLFAPTPGLTRLEETRAVLDRMTTTLTHRGPDDHGAWIDSGQGVALGHRRLSILDLSPSGRQPMASACGRYVAAFNGELYNFKSLRAELEKSGVKFRGTSDTEVLLACVSRHGIFKSLEFFNGMFAMAIWDLEERVLHLVRDRFGEKPLYYGGSGGDFVFGSELKALRAHPKFDRRIDPAALSAYFRYNFVPQPLSIYRGIFKVPAGASVSVCFNSGTRSWEAGDPVRYWSAGDRATRAAADPFRGSESEAIAALEVLFRDAVRMRLESDVPLGAFLSGGVDSSLVTAYMRDGRQSVNTFSIGFAESSHDESAHAAAVAKILGTAHAALTVTAREALEVLPALPRLYDEPFADSSQIPTHLVSRFARTQVTVSLSGDGADELFGGYVRHVRGPSVWRSLTRVPRFLRGVAGQLTNSVSPATLDGIAKLLPGSAFSERHFGDKLHKLARSVGADSALRFYLSLLQAGAGTDVVVGSHDSGDPLQESLSGLWDPARGFAANAMLCDAVGYLEGDILAKVDRASMGVGLESRAPFLDPRVFEFAWRLPENLKIRDGVGKFILRKLLSKSVPEEVFARPKTGFHLPLGSWLRGPLRDWCESLLVEKKLEESGYLRASPVLKLWQEHLSGTFNHEERLWGILTFQAWLEEGGA